MGDPTYNYYEDRAEVSIKIGDIEFSVRGYSADDALKIVKGLPLNSEEKSAPPVREERIDDFRHLRRGQKLKATRDNAGDYFFWQAGEIGEVEQIEFNDDLIVLSYKGESDFGNDAETWTFYDHEIYDQFVKISEEG